MDWKSSISKTKGWSGVGIGQSWLGNNGPKNWCGLNSFNNWRSLNNGWNGSVLSHVLVDNNGLFHDGSFRREDGGLGQNGGGNNGGSRIAGDDSRVENASVGGEDASSENDLE